MTIPPGSVFASAYLKVERAKRHIEEVKYYVSRFLESDFYRVVSKLDPRDDSHGLGLEINPPPVEIALATGDAIHSLRAALDHIASTIARRAKPADTRTSFPMHEERKNLEDALSKSLITMAAPHLKAIFLDEIRAYRTGNERLWSLNKLDNIDKHRMILLTTVITEVRGVSAKSQHSVVMGCTLLADRAGFTDLIGSSSPFDVEDNGKATASITFCQGGPFENEPVVPTLLQLTELVSHTIKLIEKYDKIILD